MTAADRLAILQQVQHIRAISLDLDDTLWEIMPVIRRAEAALWRWLHDNFPEIPVRFTADAALALRQQVIDEYVDRSHDLRFVRKTVLARMAETAGYESTLVEPAFEVFNLERNRVELFPDVLPALTSLAGHYRIIAVTNGNADLAAIGIRHLFADVVTAADAGAAKPAAAIFERAVERAGVSARETLHVGDHPEFDIAGAAAIGMTTAWMNRRDDEWPAHLGHPDAIVKSVAELHLLLAARAEDTPAT